VEESGDVLQVDAIGAIGCWESFLTCALLSSRWLGKAGGGLGGDGILG